MSATILHFPGAPFMEVIFRLCSGVATTLVVPRASVEKARIGDVFPVDHDGVQFKAEVIAMRPVWEDY